MSRMNQLRMNHGTNEFFKNEPITNELCHKWIRIVHTYKHIYIYVCIHIYVSWRLDQVELRMRTRYEWIMSRMNDVTNEYVSCIRRDYQVSTRRNGAWDSMMSESCDEWIVSRLNQSRLNQLRMNQLRMNHVTDEWCREWIRILNAQELWNLDPGEQHKRTRLRLKQPCWGKIRWSRLYSCRAVTAYIYVYTYTHVYAHMLRVEQVVYVWFYECNCIAVR